MQVLKCSELYLASYIYVYNIDYDIACVDRDRASTASHSGPGHDPDPAWYPDSSIRR